MESVILSLTIVVGLGGLIMIGVLLNMIRRGDYSGLTGNRPRVDVSQRNARTAAPSVARQTSIRSEARTARPTRVKDLATLLLLRREPEVAHFSEDPLELTDVQKKKVAEDLAEIRKRAG
jgi:hypothetical protein